MSNPAPARKNAVMTHIARSSFIIAVFFGFDKVLGLLRQVLIARQFQLSYEIDVFNAANNIPDLLSALISGGALGVAMIPVLSEFLQNHGRPAAWQVFTRILNLAFLVTAAFSLLIALLAEPIVRLIVAPGFPPQQQALTVELMRLDLFAILIFSISGLVMAGLQANQHFLLPALAPGLYNIGQIFGAGVLAPTEPISLGPVTLPAFGLGIHGLVYGVILGALLHLLIQVPGLLRYQFRWEAALNLDHPGVRQVLRLLGPRVLTMFFLQLFFIARDNIASRLGEGAVTALNLGWFIMQVPETLIGTAMAIALLPTLSEMFARSDQQAFTQTIHQAFDVLLALTLPIAAILAVGVQPLIEFGFGFQAADAERVAWATRAYLLGLAGHSLLELAARSFYAHQDARTPLYLAAINVVVYIVLAVSLSGPLGTSGIALANSLAFTTEAFALLYLLNRRFKGVLQADPSQLRALAAAGLGSLLVFGIMRWLPVPPLFASLAGLAVGGLAILPIIWPELRTLLRLGDSQNAP
jgi:putative peptidoglycan lipid II flippase